MTKMQGQHYVSLLLMVLTNVNGGLLDGILGAPHSGYVVGRWQHWFDLKLVCTAVLLCNQSAV